MRSSVTSVCGSAPTVGTRHASIRMQGHSKETSMYIGGGILGTILIIALIVWVVRRV
jgi:hypothetical protein